MAKKYINIYFDHILAPGYFDHKHKGSFKVVGERYGSYVIQFASIASATSAILAYKNYAMSLGYGIRPTTDYSTAISADVGNHSAWHVHKLDTLKREVCFYLN